MLHDVGEVAHVLRTNIACGDIVVSQSRVPFPNGYVGAPFATSAAPQPRTETSSR